MNIARTNARIESIKIIPVRPVEHVDFRSRSMPDTRQKNSATGPAMPWGGGSNSVVFNSRESSY